MYNYLCNIIKEAFRRLYISPCWSKFKTTIITDCMHWTHLDHYLSSLSMNNKAVLCNCHIFDDQWGVSAWGMSAQEGCLSRGSPPGGGGSCDLSDHAFDATCMLSPHQVGVNTSAAAYIVWRRCMLGYHPPLWTELQTGVKILPCRNFVEGGNNPFHVLSRRAILMLQADTQTHTMIKHYESETKARNDDA